MRLAPLASVAFAVLSVATTCLAYEKEAFELRKNRFDAGQYQEAHDGFAALLDPKSFPCEQIAEATAPCRLTTPDLVERARTIDAASLLALRREGEADEQIATLLRTNPQYGPSPDQFPQELIDRFTIVRGRIQRELDALAQRRKRDEEQRQLAVAAHDAWIEEIRRLAEQERVVQTNSRWVAMVPFGVGHFQNGTYGRAWGFLVGETLAGATSLVAVLALNKIAATDLSGHTGTPSPNTYATLTNQANTATLINRVAFATWAATTFADVAWAQIEFVPARVTTRKRALPPPPAVTVIATPMLDGVTFGLSGRF